MLQPCLRERSEAILSWSVFPPVTFLPEPGVTSFFCSHSKQLQLLLCT